MSCTDAEMLIATQIAYLNVNTNNREAQTVEDVVQDILRRNGTYDSSTGKYVLNEGVSGAEKAQFETAQNILDLSEKNNVVSWRHWSVVDSCNDADSGYYGCLIDTGDGNAILGCRGSESCTKEQTWKDWIVADVGRLNNPLTQQQEVATEYVKRIYEKYGETYNSFSMTGHSLGGSLATHSAISAPEGMQDKIDRVVSYDGPGFSNEYLQKFAKQIERIHNKIYHYEYSWVGALLFQPDGVHNQVIKAHDDEVSDGIFASQLVRHHTRNVEFDENGNVIEGERGVLQDILDKVSKYIEIMPKNGFVMMLPSYLYLLLISYGASVVDQLLQNLEETVKKLIDKASELYHDFLSAFISGEYEIQTSYLTSMSEDFDSGNGQLMRIADEIKQIKGSLPYDSASAVYYKHVLGTISNAILSEGRKAEKLSKKVDEALLQYNKGDQCVEGVFV